MLSKLLKFLAINSFAYLKKSGVCRFQRVMFLDFQTTVKISKTKDCVAGMKVKDSSFTDLACAVLHV